LRVESKSGLTEGNKGNGDSTGISVCFVIFYLLSDNLDQHSLFSSAVEFAVENLFPRAEIQFAFGNRDDDFPAHDLTFEVGVSVVFAGAIVPIGGSRSVRR